jgi:DNA-binding CsgD family transcriptional regulator
VKTEVAFWDLVEHLFDAPVDFEQADELIAHGDARIERADVQTIGLSDLPRPVISHQMAGQMRILEQMPDDEFQRVNGFSEIRTAAVVLTHDGQIVAANDSAVAVFGLQPGDSIRRMPLDPAGIEEFVACVAEVAASDRVTVMQLRQPGLDRFLMMILRTMASGNGQPEVLVVTTEQLWPETVSSLLARVFALTRAEIEVVRLLTAGETVASIARATKRCAGTVRCQLHAILEKTGTRSQAEIVRLAMLLLESARTTTPPSRRRPGTAPTGSAGAISAIPTTIGTSPTRPPAA